MIIRATQRAMMSRAVTRTLVGWCPSISSGVVGPALRGKGPQLRGEPSVQHIRVLVHVMAHVSVLLRGVLPAAVLAVEDGDAVAPPQLARDAPVLEVVHPGEVGLRPALDRTDLAVLETLVTSTGNKPLLTKAQARCRSGSSGAPSIWSRRPSRREPLTMASGRGPCQRTRRSRPRCARAQRIHRLCV